MKQLEDIIKERLEGYICELPEGSLEEFRARLDRVGGAGPAGGRGRKVFVWMASTAAVAGLALFLLLRGVRTPELLIPGQSVASVTEITAQASPEPEVPGLPGPAAVGAASSGPEVSGRPGPAAVGAASTGPVETGVDGRQAALSRDVDAGAAFTDADAGAPSADAGMRPADVFSGVDSSTVQKAEVYDTSTPADMRIGRTRARHIGRLGTLACVGAIPPLLGFLGGDADFGMWVPPIASPIYNESQIASGDMIRNHLESSSHSMPLHTGISLRVPVSGRFYLLSGLDFSWYSDEFTYSLSGKYQQEAFYLGIPLRLDYSLVQGRWLEAYMGAGLSSDFCVSAKAGGKTVGRDGLSLSVLGAFGVQFNISEHLGLFLDPTVSWCLAVDKRVLDTYRSEHPLMFSLSSGIRFTLPDIHGRSGRTE